MRLTKPRVVITHNMSIEVSHNGSQRFAKVPRGEIYEELDPTEKACENDVAIYQRLQETCFQKQGSWKSRLAFYGITDAREVKVR